jgi:hypothetical protein
MHIVYIVTTPFSRCGAQQQEQHAVANFAVLNGRNTTASLLPALLSVRSCMMACAVRRFGMQCLLLLHDMVACAVLPWTNVRM